MDNKNMASGNLGSIGKYSVDFIDGKLVISESASVEGIEESFSLSLSSKSLLDGIAKKIGGPIPTEIAQFLELSLGLK